MRTVSRTSGALAPSITHATDVAVAVERSAGQQLFGFALRLGLRPDEADDSVQESLLRLFREISAGTDIEDPRAWAFRALYRIAMDEHRFHRRVEALRERLVAVAPSRATAQGAPGGSIWGEVDTLPSRQRQALFLHYQADLAFDQVAEIMGITPGGARAVAARGVAELRRRLEPDGRDA